MTSFDVLTTYGHVKVYGDPATGTCVVSDRGTWLSGVYADEEAARRAVDVPDAVLSKRTRWQARGQGADYRPITLEEVRGWLQAETNP